MRIYNATNSVMNLPLANGSRLIIKSKELSKQFYPTVEMLNLLVSAYTRDDIAIIIDSSSELSMGALISALPGYVVEDENAAVLRFHKSDKDEKKDNSKSSPNLEKSNKTETSSKEEKKLSTDKKSE